MISLQGGLCSLGKDQEWETWEGYWVIPLGGRKALLGNDQGWETWEEGLSFTGERPGVRDLGRILGDPTGKKGFSP